MSFYKNIKSPFTELKYQDQHYDLGELGVYKYKSEEYEGDTQEHILYFKKDAISKDDLHYVNRCKQMYNYHMATKCFLCAFTDLCGSSDYITPHCRENGNYNDYTFKKIQI